MAKVLTQAERQFRHQAHIRRDRSFSSSVYELPIQNERAWDELTPEVQKNIAGIYSELPDITKTKFVQQLGVLHVEICDECGFMGPPICLHKEMEWKHLPQFYDDEGELVPHTDRDLPDEYPVTLSKEAEPCTGCLLECKLCRADGT